jgi:hypothetical protein
MKTALAVPCALALAVSAWTVSPSFAQSNPDGYVMLVPGVYTTPEISAKCQAFAAQRVVGGSNTDTSRQAVALACAKKLHQQQNAKKGGKKKTAKAG